MGYGITGSFLIICTDITKWYENVEMLHNINRFLTYLTWFLMYLSDDNSSSCIFHNPANACVSVQDE